MKKKVMKKFCLGSTMLLSLVWISCAATTKPNWFDRQVFTIQTNYVPIVVLRTNTEMVTNEKPVYIEREVVRVITNDVGTLTIHTNVIVTTNVYQEVAVYTNFHTITNYSEEYSFENKPGTSEGISTVGGIINTVAPGWGGLFAVIATGAIGIYKNIRNKKAQRALIQGIETAREVIKNVSPDPTMDQRFKDWLEDQQRKEGVKGMISGQVDKGAADTPAAREEAGAIVAEASSDTTRIRNMNAVPPTPGVVPPVPPAPPGPRPV